MVCPEDAGSGEGFQFSPLYLVCLGFDWFVCSSTRIETHEFGLSLLVSDPQQMLSEGLFFFFNNVGVVLHSCNLSLGESEAGG